MLDRTALKKALIRLLSGLVFLGIYVFMLFEISMLINQAIVWITGIVFVLYGVLQYREYIVLRAGATETAGLEKPKHKWLSTVQRPVFGVILIAADYFLTPVLPQVLYLLAGIWLSFSGLARGTKLVISIFAGKGRQKTKLIQTAVIAAVLVVIDAFVLGSFYIAVALLIIVVPLNFLKALRLRADRPARKLKFMDAGIYAIAAVLIIAAFVLNDNLAKQRLANIAAACEQYKDKYGEYPPELIKLQPEFIKEIPSAKIGFFVVGFKYISRKESHAVMYVKLPPYGKSFYTLETKQWEFHD